MDNGVEDFAGSHEGERKRLEDGISEESVVGSDKLKESEGEEVFEEAIDAQEHFHDQGAEHSSGHADVVKEDDSGAVGVSATGAVDENNDAAQEVENFEEAIGVAGDSGNMEGELEVIVNHNVDKNREEIDRIHLDGIDSGGTGDGVLPNESYSMKDDQLEGGDRIGGKEVSELEGGDQSGGKEVSGFNADRAIGAAEDGAMVDINSGLSIDRPDNEDSKNVTSRSDGFALENGSTDKEEEIIIELATESESFEEMLNQGSDTAELKESDVHAEFRDDKTEERLDASDDPNFEIKEDKGIEVDAKLANGDVDHLDERTIDLKNDDPGTDKRDGDGSGKEMSKFSSKSVECEDYSNQQTKDAEAGSASVHQEATVELEGTSPDPCEPAEQREGAVDAGSPSTSENFTTVKIQNVQASTTDLKERSIKDYQPQNADEGISRGHANYSEVEEPEKVDKNAKEELNTQVTGKKNHQPAPELTPLSEKSVGTVTPAVRPAGLGRAAPLLEPAPRVAQQARVNGSVSNAQSQQIEDSANVEAEEYDETREKLQMIRVKFLRLAHRLGQTPHNVVVAQVLYRLGLAEQLRGRNGGRVGAFSFDRSSAMAEQLEAAGQEPLDFSCTIMVLGKTGVGKSATINSIFDEVKFNTDAFYMGTKRVQDVVGTVQGIKVRVIDTPGLLPSWSDQRQNEKILHSVKKFIKKTPPDIVLYLDRLDMQSQDSSDMPLLRTITEIFGPSIWFNAIVVLTHAASAPPDGPNGTASSYDMFVTQRSHVVQQAIRQAAGDMRLMNPVSLVENHSACRTNRAGQRVLPNGQVWKPHLLLLSFASKILAEANALLKLQDSPPGRPFAARARAPPLPFLLSSLLQSRPQLKLAEEQFGDEDGLDDDLDDSSDSEDETEIDDLPPFKPLTKAQVETLSKAQKKAYFDELEYREKLFVRKQLKEEKKRRKMMMKMAEAAKDLPTDNSENVEEESGDAASVPVPMPDLVLPASFDSDNPTHRYRSLDSSNQWLVRPVLEAQGWDHDVGYEGINVERLFVVKDKIPLSFSGQVTKDKKDANVQMEINSSLKHGEGKATSLGFEMQNVGKDLAYTLRSETRFSNLRRNKATAGLSVTLLGDSLSGGVKIEDKLVAGKRFKLVISGGAMAGRGDVAYGGSLEAQLRDKDYPLGRSLSTLGLSVMDWHGDLAIGCNLQSQIPVGRYTNLIARGNLNNRGAGQISIRLNSSEQLQIALIGLLPLVKKIFGYHQQWQFGQ
ncbi:hypothetical protein L6164_033303 [Bauhinia variegata]|uniref:Uncharacterized protein n=1 Tax=Bauhinia variegata TaxID=167791 RepID=A0ACB9KRH9_BAUVA|nr:hypothetical protein L6164_033303 [Bauhinia variegata]